MKPGKAAGGDAGGSSGPAGAPPRDTDGDGLPDNVDNDDDNDGIPDVTDPDDDNDGVPDHMDEDHPTNPGQAPPTPHEPAVPGDFDGDGIAGNSAWDIDMDDDGHSDLVERYAQAMQAASNEAAMPAGMPQYVVDSAHDGVTALERQFGILSRVGNLGGATAYRQERAATFAPGTARGLMPPTAILADLLTDHPETSPELQTTIEGALDRTRTAANTAMNGVAGAVAVSVGQDLASTLGANFLAERGHRIPAAALSAASTAFAATAHAWFNTAQAGAGEPPLTVLSSAYGSKRGRPGELRRTLQLSEFPGPFGITWTVYTNPDTGFITIVNPAHVLGEEASSTEAFQSILPGWFSVLVRDALTQESTDRHRQRSIQPNGPGSMEATII